VKIVVDTNIVFSGLLNSSSGIGKLLIASQDHFHFYTCEYLKTELTPNRAKLKKLTNLSDTELDSLIELVTANITTIMKS
jgi:predicted nucleic acid-binding protein